jgi:tetratricopeptide (TPR) repeat protein
MGMISRVLAQLSSAVGGSRSYTHQEVQEMIQRGLLEKARLVSDHLHKETPQREEVALCLAGEIAFRKRDDAQAERLFLQALSTSPGLPNGHHGLSLLLFERGEVEAALRHAQFAINGKSHHARFFAQLGLCHLTLRNYRQAAGMLSRATRLDPHDKSSWNNLGIASRAHGDLSFARRAFKRALEIDASFERAISNLELVEGELLQLRGSDTVKDKTICVESSASDVRLQQVRALRGQDRLTEALDACELLCIDSPDDGAAVIELFALNAFLISRPEDEAVGTALIHALVKERDFRTAKPLLEKALERRPQDTALMVAMAEVRMEQGKYLNAGELIEKAFALEPSIDMKGRLAASYLARCDYERTLQLTDEMVAEDPAQAERVAAIRVDALTYCGRFDEALPILDKLIERTPNDHGRRFPRANIHLLNERYAQGWDDYTYRNLASTEHLRMVALPQWSGQPLQGKRLLVLAEQGLGDQVMFASCLSDLIAQQPARLVVEVVDRVAPTIARSFPQAEVVPSKQDRRLEWVKDVGEMDYFAAIGDLPRLYRRSREDFPAHDGYLKADPERVVRWRGALEALGPGPKIGVSWKGGTEPTRTVMRTMQARQLAGLAEAVDAQWVCMQYGPVTDALAQAREAGMPLHYWPQAIKNLDEFAALCCALDLVITVCNTTVHYAGALGRPVWVMAPRIPEWRYGLMTASMPWYPSSKLFRQPTSGDWQPVLDRIADELATRFGRPGASAK